MGKKRDEALPGLDLDDVRHPMWTKPVLNDEDPVHTQTLYVAVWSSMLPFDGRPYSDGIIWFAEQVWFLCGLETARNDPFWLIGHVIRLRQEALRRAVLQDHNEWSPVILRLANEYVDAIAGVA